MKFCPSCGTEYPTNTSVCKHDQEVLRQKTGDRDSLVGIVIKGAYRIDERIAAGGMSNIYRGTQLVIDRPVAIKVLLPNLQPDATFVRRFFREARLLGNLTHPNIVGMIDCGQLEQGTVFLVTEYLKGKTLLEVIKPKKGLSFAQTVCVMRDVCAAVSEAHAHRVVHRDIKPSNIFILKTAASYLQAKVLDFGIAKSLENHAVELTRAGAIVGTPGYMAPEQIKAAGTIDHRADVYALGALLYLMAGGKSAFVGKNNQERLAKQLTEDPQPLELEALGKPQELWAVILKAMQRDPGRRYQTVKEMFEALEHCVGSVQKARPAISAEDPTLFQEAYSGDASKAEKKAKPAKGKADKDAQSLPTDQGVLAKRLKRWRNAARVASVFALLAFGVAGLASWRLLAVGDPWVASATSTLQQWLGGTRANDEATDTPTHAVTEPHGTTRK
jgi:serine/threonine protein kinase